MQMIPALLVAVLGALAIEAANGRSPVRRRPGDLAIRLACYALIMLFWFQFSWRPWLAGASCLLTLAIATMVDRLKREVIGEPLVFSDLALIPQVPRHPDLYYTVPLSDPRMVAAILASVSGVALWYYLEPSLLPDGISASLAALLAIPLGFLGAVRLARTAPAAAWLRARCPVPNLEDDVGRFGVLGTMMLYGLRRAAERREAEPIPAVIDPAVAPGDDVVVVVQLESFLDPVRLGGPPLPLMARVAAGAVQHGRLAVPSHGAYTMRSEHAVLTGANPDTLGFGRFDPYLAYRGGDPTSLARLARSAGYETVFIHPYHRDFFARAAVMTAFGFDRLVMQEDFAGAERVGSYIGDVPVAERILAEVRARKGPIFVFCVTMENHGPWKPGRLPGIDDPLEQYLHHIANTGRAAEMLIDGLAGERATLCLFGDHPPSLPGYRRGAEAPQTDYALFRFGRSEPGEPRQVALSASELGRVLRCAVSGCAEAAAKLSVAVPPS